MVLEIADFAVLPGTEDEFAAAVHQVGDEEVSGFKFGTFDYQAPLVPLDASHPGYFVDAGEISSLGGIRFHAIATGNQEVHHAHRPGHPRMERVRARATCHAHFTRQ